MNRSLRAVLLVSSSLLAGCGAEPASQGGSPPVSTPEKTAASLVTTHPSCEGRAAVLAHMNQVCVVAGRYEIKTFAGKKGSSLGDWPIVVLADGTEVMIESLWDPSKKPAPEVVEKLRGKKVLVQGELRSSPPKESPENFGFFCVSPVQSLSVAPP